MSQPSPEMTNGQQSSVGSTRSGISALEAAHTAISTSRQHVEDTKNNLSSTYTGSDGYNYGNLITDWETQCDIILKNLQDMIDTLNTSLTQHTQTQSGANEAIHHANNAGQAVFDTLAGHN